MYTVQTRNSMHAQSKVVEEALPGLLLSKTCEYRAVGRDVAMALILLFDDEHAQEKNHHIQIYGLKKPLLARSILQEIRL